MAKYASKVVEQAKAWLGYKESDGTHKEIIDVYNAHKPLARGYKVKCRANGDSKNDDWCATFVSSVAIKLGYTSIMPTECGCEEMIKKYQKLGCFIENESVTPAPAWVLFYDWQDDGVGDNRGYANHVGIVEKVVGNTITVIEGNKKDSVTRVEIAVNGKYIRGYGVPKYDKEVPPKAESKPKSVTEIAKEVINGKWGNGSDRANKLTTAGHDYYAVQAEVNRILAGKKTISELAKEVIAGKWGVGQKRKKRLMAEGYDYYAVQAEVNRLLK